MLINWQIKWPFRLCHHHGVKVYYSDMIIFTTIIIVLIIIVTTIQMRLIHTVIWKRLHIFYPYQFFFFVGLFCLSMSKSKVDKLFPKTKKILYIERWRKNCKKNTTNLYGSTRTPRNISNNTHHIRYTIIIIKTDKMITYDTGNTYTEWNSIKLLTHHYYYQCTLCILTVQITVLVF